MREQLEERLRTLKAEFKTGQEMLAELEAKGANLRVTLTRISGAVQVLEELLQQDAPDRQLADSAPMSRPSVAA